MAKTARATISKAMAAVGVAAQPREPRDYGVALNFRVPADFMKYFKIAAAHREMNQTELLMTLCLPELQKHGYD
jgi:hypothetical protein